ncbi:Uma2 family endonuclease [Crocosphaera chwakensis]|uniref:Putative restriction endonuclease domain-containing protein n=1 Tax=Crocosphaera chwakensis CCY0110 TaxID=391612 RepID=A3IH69_9CHRO|nr:Uma2 family endonuclease [Crocosphaera chwakensis]EAZ94311.1 hypothetical protein CY0110_10562 [Crocosphaera chwakensis CCY0110]
MIIGDRIKTSSLVYARVAGVLYLIIIVCGLFSEMYVRSNLIIRDNAVTAERSPDVSWIKLERWNQLTLEQREKFPPIAPNFVLELMSPSDSLKNTQDKMEEYQANGVKLGWLIDRKSHQVEIYRQGQAKEVLNEPKFLLGEDILPEFILNLAMVW